MNVVQEDVADQEAVAQEVAALIVTVDTSNAIRTIYTSLYFVVDQDQITAEVVEISEIEAHLVEEMILAQEIWKKEDALAVVKKVIWEEIALTQEEAGELVLVQDLTQEETAEEAVVAEATQEVLHPQEAETQEGKMLDLTAETEDQPAAKKEAIPEIQSPSRTGEALQGTKAINSINRLMTTNLQPKRMLPGIVD